MVFSLSSFEGRLSGMLDRAIKKGTLSVLYPSGEQVDFGNGENPKAPFTFKTQRLCAPFILIQR